MRQRVLRTLVVVNVLATIGAIVWAAVWLFFGDLALYDTNLEAFKFALSPEQGRGITAMAGSLLSCAVIPLMITNCVWLAVVVARWLMVVEPEDSPPPARPRESVTSPLG